MKEKRVIQLLKSHYVILVIFNKLTQNLPASLRIIRREDKKREKLIEDRNCYMYDRGDCDCESMQQ